MSAQSYEIHSEASPPNHLHVVPDLIDDDIHNSLQAYLGATPRLLGYDATLVKDFTGPANDKQQVGGRMIVRLTVDTQSETLDVVVDDYEKPFSEDVLCELGKIANKNFSRGKGVYNDLFSA